MQSYQEDKRPNVKVVGINTLRFSRICSITKTEYQVDVPLNQWKAWQEGVLIQKALPELNSDQREFLMSGMTPAEWEALYGAEECDTSETF